MLSEDQMKAMSNEIKTAIDGYSVGLAENEHRNHLGASVIGHECNRHIWSIFRWLDRENISGRNARLFRRGHREEPELLGLLVGTGWSVYSVDPSTGKQYRITSPSGHFGGSADSIATHPQYTNADGSLRPFIVELKTHNTNQFGAVVREGVRKAKPQHYAQMCAYGRYYGIEYGLYLPVNKNDDDIAPEIVWLDPSVGEDLERKAESIVWERTAPRKISKSAAFFVCKLCAFSDICHLGKAPEVNCRSCKHARADVGKVWFCERHNGQIPGEIIPTGCADGYERIV